jgi:hypothetical protein
MVREGLLVVFPEPVITVTGTEAPANAWEFWFQIGQPYTTPSPGTIYFTTNSALMATSDTMANAQLQLAETARNDAGFYFAVLSRAAVAGGDVRLLPERLGECPPR